MTSNVKVSEKGRFSVFVNRGNVPKYILKELEVLQKKVKNKQNDINYKFAGYDRELNLADKNTINVKKKIDKLQIRFDSIEKQLKSLMKFLQQKSSTNRKSRKSRS
jgi:paraquat-inducible protein B